MYRMVHDYATVVVDNTNIRVWEIAPYMLGAAAYKFDVEIIELQCDFETAYNRNTHGVPEGTMREMNWYLQNEKLLPFWKRTVIRHEPGR
jgi:hypothetical protein